MLQRIGQFASKTFLLWMLLASLIAFIIPDVFKGWGIVIPYLLGVVMLGMGLTVTVDDFKLVLKEPKAVLIGVALQYTIMPLTAYAVVKLFQLPPDIAIGVILVGCCPGGTSSNVISYLAKGNVSLSVTITTVSTVLASFLTPLLMYGLAREWMNVSLLAMFISVLKVVLVPLLLGIIIQRFFKRIAEVGEDILPLISVIAISIILATVVAGSRALIIQTGLLIFAVVILHNMIGYLLGFWLSYALKLNYANQKTVAIEVGMQNSGLASSLATVHFNPLAAVPGAIFSVVHLVTGPLLAKYWASKVT
ncbi:bile acid:sodium symporter family protein [Staphylococcus lutrae]|uniref:Symporter n=1 Tax=Staphylococcus lutrae TaxID=155085 RepID=A0AAC9RTH8_9STAP|nr:bile acid:sodium symporter family protein [Staphylococcus lutrae]ARJ50480.1 symporter [Staphylococcus lutrae]PNZ38208.1 bile acid:sodium symporter family protein [Staphylococcus lutrae]